MTREKALEVNRLLCKIEDYEAVIEELNMSETIDAIQVTHGEGQSLYEELKAVVQVRLDKLLKELEAM